MKENIWDADNIKNVWEWATPQELADGMTWYSDQYNEISKIANMFGVEIKRAVYATSALSPNIRWDRNLVDLISVIAHNTEDLVAMCESYEEGEKTAYTSLNCTTYSSNVNKAVRIILYGEFELVKGQKTKAFADNLFNIDSDQVTIDRHAYNIAQGERVMGVVGSKKTKIPPKEYLAVSNAYREVADQLAIKPYQLQAITWLTWRRMNGIK